MSTTPNIILASLYKSCIPGIDDAWGILLAKAGAMHLSKHRHPAQVLLPVQQASVITKEVQGKSSTIQNGTTQAVILDWDPTIVTAQAQRAWGDQDETTEYAACGIACLLIIELTEYTVIERAFKGSDQGFDYWLGFEDDPELIYRGRLEASGIFHGNSSQVAQRARQKIQQTNASDHLGIPAYAVVVEFSSPTAKMVFKP